jgi:hypothetical protein
MKKNFILLFVILLFSVVFAPLKSISQIAEVRNAVYSDVSIPLRDMKPVKSPFWKKWMKEIEPERQIPNKFKDASPNIVDDNALQTEYFNGNKSTTVVPDVNFNGLNNSNNTGGRVTPPDPAGDVGPNHYVQAVNCMLQMFNKSGTSLYGPVTTSTIWNGFSGNWSGHNDGDAIILYDEAADRWLISQFAIDCTTVGGLYTEYQLVAISATSDPLGAYYRYAFQFDYMPDYGKLGIWGDGYYMAINRFNTNVGGSWVGAGAVVMERSKMLTGDPAARMVYFKTETLGGSGSSAGNNCGSMLPSDCDGTPAPAGTPNYFVYDDQPSSELRIWALHADWTTPTNSTFTYVTKLTVAAYTELATSSAVSQQGTTLKLDGLGDRLMFRNQYRNFGSYETFVTCRSVSTGGVAGVRWYEYRKTGSTFSLYQQATYAPADGKSRWMGSIAMNASGDIGLAYSVSSSTMYPSIYFTGRKAADALNQLTIPEGVIQNGAVSMTGTYTRWGDYSAMNVDPADNNTFWATQEYVGSFGGSYPWATKIASFKFANTPIVTTLAATAVTVTSAMLNGTVNPNGFATDYHFEWGTTTGYGSNTATVAAGAGSTAIAVNAPISGLIGGTTYHFRLVGVNIEGTSNGNDMTFTPGGAVVTTTAVTGITLNGATSGGNVTSDGGAAVSARGVCWATTANPVVTGNHTTDGAGTGTFTSAITGLSANTVYHVRAYATNANGTFYGADIQFATLCGIYSLPFTEAFAGTTIPSCWSQVDIQGGGQIWQFGVIPSQTPLPNLTGNYAYLNSDGYGSGNTQNADLISPTIDMTAYSAVNLQFKHYFISYAGSSGTLSYSINNGTSWAVIQTITATSATNPVTFNQAIAGVAGQAAVKFKWNYTGTWGYSWAVDDVQITGTGSVALAVTPANQNVTAPAGTTPFAVTTTAATWTAISNSAWCTVTPSGSGNGTLSAVFTANTGAASRVANITVSATGAAPVVVTVTQAGTAPTLSVTPANQNVTSPAGNTSFSVTSNSAWTAVSNAAWCTVTLSGSGNGTIAATYTQNILLVGRTANITVTVIGLTPVVVTVTQAAGSPTLTVTPANQNVSAVAGNTNFAVTSNSAWTVSSNAAWCTVTPSGTGDGTLVASYTANVLVTSRIATITVTVTGLTPVTVTVTQSGSSPTLSVTPANQNVTAPAGNTSFSVSSNSAWTASSNSAWCTVTLAGSGNGIIAATYTTNTLLAVRVANITVTVAGLTPVVVTVTQAGAVPTLVVTPENIDVPATAGAVNYTVTTNSPWTATSGTFWCMVTPSGSGSGPMAAVYEANTSLNQRITYMAVSVPGAANANITLTQAGAEPFLTVDPHQQNVGNASGTVNFTISTNLSWTATSNAAWCTISNSGSGSGNVVATFAENTFAANRTASITFAATGIIPISTTVTIIQAGPSATLNVTPASRTVTDPAGSATFAVAANTTWTSSSDANWCQAANSGSGNGITTATYQQNLTPYVRTANIQVLGAGTVPATVQVLQLPSFVSVDENPQNTFQVFPNPTSGLFVLSGTSTEMLFIRVTIFDPQGKTILTRQCTGANSYSFDLSQEGSGSYFMKVESKGKTHMMKVIVQ